MRLALSFTILLLATPVYAGPPVGNLLPERGVQKEKTEEKVGGLPSAKEPAEEAPRAMLSPNQAPAFVSDDPRSHITAPDQNAPVRLNPEAPGPFLAMAEAYQRGDSPTAKLFARQFVRYLADVMFQVRDLTRLIGEAMVEEGMVDEESWVGVEQFVDRQMAEAREATGAAIRPTQEEAIKRIKADPKGEVEVYYFFSLTCSYCRKMAPDVERLWRATQADSKVKMVALTIGNAPKDWVNAYRKYYDMSVPVLRGDEIAKKMRVGLVPALIVAAPNAKTVYLKSGQQSFERMYQVVRAAQGQSQALTPELRRLLNTPVGESERASKKTSAVTAGRAQPMRVAANTQEQRAQRF